MLKSCYSMILFGRIYKPMTENLANNIPAYEAYLKELYGNTAKDMTALLDNSKHTDALRKVLTHIEKVLGYTPHVQRIETLRRNKFGDYSYHSNHSHLTNSYTVLWENEDGGTLTPSEALSFIQGEEFKDVRKALGLALKAGLFSPEVTVWYRRYTDSGNVARQRNEAHALAFMDFWFEELFGYPLDDENVSHTYKVMDDRGNFEEAF